MSWPELAIIVACAFVAWVFVLHLRILALRQEQDATSEHLRGVADQVNRLQRDARSK